MLAEFNELYPDDSPEDEEPSSEERNVSLKDLVVSPCLSVEFVVKSQFIAEAKM
ncbi:unnamed protein product [Cylicostephanus goldi]|uniref:Uncharacterized protein n=1 Tax=Cylicostephanus goldi TaxID=71465 RepID=A0A3P7MZD3_CYLGO|nr:unnamed protein product [Cylicostephanus goldi]